MAAEQRARAAVTRTAPGAAPNELLTRAPRHRGRRPDRALRLFLLACGAAAVVVAAVAQIVMPAEGDRALVWVTVVFLPAFIVTLVGVGGRDRRSVVAICALIYLEAMLLAVLYAVAMAFAILLPMIAIGIVQPYVGRRGRAVLYASAVLVASASVLIVELGIPRNPLGREDEALAATAFALVAAFTLGLTWRAQEQLTEALADAETEIEARVEAERRARETADALDRLVRSSAVATIVLDPEGRVTVWNQAATKLFGEDERDVIGRPLPLVTFTPEIERTEDAEQRPPQTQPPDLAVRLLGAEAIEGETVEVVTADGRRVLVEIHSAPRHDDEGVRRGTIVQLVDVTARTALEAELRQTQKMEAIGHVAGGVAHDINNTLTAVGGFAELIQSETADPTIRGDAQMIAASAQRAADLTSRLLAFARRSVLQPHVIDASAFLESVRPVVERLVGEEVRVETVDEVQAASIEVDPAQLEQAVLNLASNARDAMPGGGRLTLAVRHGELRGPDGSTVPAVSLSVSDNGEGIPPELQDRVWEPFFTTKGRGRGTGLGLAMVYGFVAQSGGTVALTSARGRGTTIEIRLPEVAAPPEGAAAEPPDAEGGTETILLVEDEPPVAEVGRRVLAGLGYRVIEAHDGAEAVGLARAEQGRIDLVLTDVMMPGIDGPETAALVRELHPEAGVLFVSGYATDVVTDRAVLPPGAELLHKPYAAAELARRVRAALEAAAP